HELDIPACGDDVFEKEKREAVYFPERKGGRTKERLAKLVIRAVVTLERGSRALGIQIDLDNQAKDHRVRALFPTDLSAKHHYADSVFEAAKRDNEPAAEWRNPSNAQHQQAFVDVCEEKAGLTVANLGLNEYEMLRDGRNTIAVTLLRSVGELGDWGVFPTPEAQCLGEHSFALTLLPHDGESGRFAAYARAYQTQTEWQTAQTGSHSGKLAPSASMLAWSGDRLAFSSMKIAEDSGDLALRWFHLGGEPEKLLLRLPEGAGRAYVSDILESRSADKAVAVGTEGSVLLDVRPFEIITVGCRS
ncbi:MAG: glycoside hydrolase family 38, partial [Paenibacillus sp.]|nr:glycoside hydrolase family 38 [Paenibacillus sp.]